MSLFDALNEIDARGEMLRDRPESEWCQMYAEQLDMWEEMGGVPADLSTVEALTRIALTLWRHHKRLAASLEQIASGEVG